MYYELKEQHGDKFKAQMGAEAIKTILSQMDVESTISELRESFIHLTGQKKIKATKRLSILESLQASGNNPDVDDSGCYSCNATRFTTNGSVRRWSFCNI